MTVKLSICIALLCAAGALAQGKGGGGGGDGGSGKGQLTFSNGDFSVSIPGGGSRPRYTFWKDGDGDNSSSTSYTVSLEHIYEVTGDNGDTKKVASSEISLNSLSWTVAESVDGDELAFALSAADGGGARFGTLTFLNHIGGQDSANQTQVKFDVDLSNYKWVSAESRLALVWSMKAGGGGGNSPTMSGDEVHVGNAYFSTAANATAGGDTVGVALFVQQNDIFLAYDHFCSDCELQHDPAFGVNGAAALSGGVFALALAATYAALRTLLF